MADMLYKTHGESWCLVLIRKLQEIVRENK